MATRNSLFLTSLGTEIFMGAPGVFLGAIKAQPQDTRFGQLTEGSSTPHKLSGMTRGTLRPFWPFLA
jgi:hypothetical protein